MSALSDDFRKRAAGQIAASAPLLEEPDFVNNPKKQALFIIGQINATILTVAADAEDIQKLTDAQAAEQARIRESMEKFNAIRQATAKGDWDEFDRLVGKPANAS